MSYNKQIDFSARGFLAVTDSVHHLRNLQFDAIFLDEAHHPTPPGLPNCSDLFKFSATHVEEVDFRYSMGEAIEDGVLCDYDLTVPVTTQGQQYHSLARLLLAQTGRFRRVLAYCNSVQQSKSFQQVLQSQGLAAWQMDAATRLHERQKSMMAFLGPLKKPVHVLVTVQVLGEGINIPNADTCLFVEPRRSYTSIVQAVGRVLRSYPAKPLAHIVLPAVAKIPDEKKVLSTGASFQPMPAHRLKPAKARVNAGDVPSHPHGDDPNQQFRQLPGDAQGKVSGTNAHRNQFGYVDASQCRALRQRNDCRAAAVPRAMVSKDQFGPGEQLERFFAVLSAADNRLLEQPLRCRLQVFDSRSNQTVPFRAEAMTVLRRLLRVMEARPSVNWQTRLRAVERFAAEHERLPIVRADKEEATLAKWLANNGLNIRRGKLPSSRLHMLLNSASTLLQERARIWLDKDWDFKQKCALLQRLIEIYGVLPTVRQYAHNPDSVGYKVAQWVVKLRSGCVHINAHRIQLVKDVHPLMSKIISEWSQGKAHIRMDSWMQRAQALKELVQRTGKLPSQMLDEEKPLYRWMVVQKQRFPFLPERARATLLTSSVLASVFSGR